MASDPTPVPSLSADGWKVGSAQKCDLLLSHFFVAETTQTHFFKQAVSSLPTLVRQYQDDPIGLTDAVQATLIQYFGSYFPKVDVRVSCEVNAVKPNTYDLRMFVSVWDQEGVEFVLARLAEHQDAKIQRIIAINNVG